MKLTIVLVLISTLSAMSSGLAQTVTLHLENTSLEAAFLTIKQQTGYRFIYHEDVLKNTGKVNLDLKDVSLKNALDKLMEHQPLTYLMHDGTIVVKASKMTTESNSLISVQQTILSGTIQGAEGEALAGVTIRNLNSGYVTLSDDNGRFEVSNVNINDRLLFSLIGYAPYNLVVANLNAQHIVLSIEDQHLDEIVVVGYGTQRRRNVVGSVSQIGGEELQKAPAMNLTNTLAGRLPGLTALQQSGRPGADNATFQIRGRSSYAGSQAPLIMIDGVERASFAYLDPSEIESISILKDAVSTAVFGLQATNGIILITTKKGKANDTKINYEGSFQIGQNTRFPKFLDAVDYMLWYNKGTDMDNDYRLHRNEDPVPYVYGPRLIRSIYDGTNTNPLFGQTDWVGELLANNSQSQHHAVSISGGNEKSRYFSSLSHLDQGGVIKNTNFKRYNVRTNVSSQLTNLLSADVRLAYRLESGQTPGLSPDNTAYMNPFYQAAMMLPNLPMYAENGIYTAHHSSPGWINPLALVEHSGYQNRDNHVFQGDVNLKFSVPGVKGLDLQVLAAYDKTSLEGKTWLQPYDLMGRSHEQRTGSFTALSTVPGIAQTSLSQFHNQNTRMTFRPYVNYANTFGEHNISVLGLYEWSKYQQGILRGGARNFPLAGLHDLEFGSTELDDLVRSTGSSSQEARAGYVARVNYAYNNKYLLEVASRWDASVAFAEHNRWKMFPGLGLGWILSDEGFFKDNITFINFFKLKYSVGNTGNDKVGGQFAYLQTYLRPENGAPVYVIGGGAGYLYLHQ